MNGRLLSLAKSIVAASVATMTLAIHDVDGQGAAVTATSSIDPSTQAAPVAAPRISIFRMITRCLSDGPARSDVDCKLLPSGSERGRE